MLSIAICDEERKSLREIEKLTTNLLNSLGYKFKISTFNNGTSLIDSEEIKDFSIILLDINMRSIDAKQTINIIRTHNKLSKIIFITEHDEDIEQSVLVKAFACLSKPLNRCVFEKTLQESIEYYQAKSKPINYIIKTTSGDVVIDLNSVIYFSYENRVIKVVTEHQVLYSYNTIKNIYEEIKCHNFCITHRSCLVNLKYVVSITSDKIILKNNHKVPLSQKRCSQFKNRMSDFIASHEILRL